MVAFTYELPARRHRAWMLAGILGIVALLPACNGGGGGGGGSSPPPATSCATGVTPAPGLVVTDFGAVQGTRTGNSYAFLGIPYAAPPVGTLRWQPPQNPACATATLQASNFPPGCLQKDFDPFSNNYTVTGSEDCLYLNVWTPANYTGAGKPVLVFIHGGGNQQGAAGQVTAGARLYDGARLAERGDAVVVTFDYRLGPLGFLTHTALTDTGGHYGNWGLLDQIQALQWVQAHIARFGGDPARVMIFGESAGAVDSCMLVVSPLANGLFARAALQSGACVAKSLAERATASAGYIATLGCDTAPDVKACLMALDGAALVAPEQKPFSGGTVNQVFGPAVDGWLLPEAPLTALAAGRFHRVPLVIGSNADETAATIPPNTVNRAMVLALFAPLPEPARSGLLALYDPGSGVSLTVPSEEARQSYIRATTDAQFTCQARRAATAAAAYTPVFRYHFTHRLNGAIGNTYGAWHGFELFYVFQSIEDSSFVPLLTADDTVVEAHMLGYWTRFAASGNPSGGGAVAWPAYDNSDPYLTLAATPVAGAGLNSAACDLWDSVTNP